MTSLSYLEMPERAWLLLLVSLALCLIGTISYARDVLHGRACPNIVSWFLWALCPLTATVVGITADVPVLALARTGIAGILALGIFSITWLAPQRRWCIRSWEILCGVASTASIACGSSTNSLEIAVALSVLADAFATVPSLIKTWREPNSETWLVYACGLTSALLSLLVIDSWTLVAAAFPVYLAVLNVTILALISRKPLLAVARTSLARFFMKYLVSTRGE